MENLIKKYLFILEIFKSINFIIYLLSKVRI